MNKESCGGYTINRKNIRHQEIHGINSKILHIELLSRNLKILKTQDFLHPLIFHHFFLIFPVFHALNRGE